MLKTTIKTSAMAAAMLLCIGTAQAAPVELVGNGGFETGDFTDWTLFPGGGTQAVSAVNPSSGSFSAEAFCTTGGTPCDNLLKSANRGVGVVTAGQEITVSFDYRGTTADGGVIFAELFSEIDGGGVSDAQLLSGGPFFGVPGDPDAWQSFSVTTTLGSDVSGGVTLQLKSSCGGAASCVSDVYFDNASMTVAAVPVPAAVWLFGSGLLGLIGVARRKKAA